MHKIARLLVALVFWPVLAFAQSDPALYNGQIPTAAQWNSYFAAKTDYPIQCATGSLYGNVSGVLGPLTCIPTSAFTNVGSAFRLVNPRTISITGDITWTSTAFDGSGNVTGVGNLANSGVTAGPYTCVNATINIKGIVTAAANGTCSGGAGTVTSVTCNAGLTGGTFTTTGTCGLDLTRANTWTGRLTQSAGAVITPGATPAINEVGYLGTPRNTQNANYTLVMADAGSFLYHTSGSAHTWTIPANASVAYPIGTVIVLANENAGGNVTIAITSDTLRWTTLTGSRTLAANGTATILKVDTTTWRLTGDGLT